MASYYIILDSNTIIRDYKLSGKSFKILLNGLSKIDGLLIIPNIVYDEVVNKYSEELQNKINKANTAIDKLNKHFIGKSSLKLSHKSFLASNNKYKNFLKHQIQINRISDMNYPTIRHSDIVSRCLNRKRPFKNDDSGYRDFLLWSNILQLVKKYTKKNIIFITNDQSDFYDNNELHPDLVNDLKNAKFNLNQFGIYKSIDTFNDATILPVLNALDNIRDELNQGKYRPFNLKKWVEKNISTLVDSKEEKIKEIGFGFPERCGTILNYRIGPISNITVEDVNEISESELFISFTITTEILMDIDITSKDWDYYSKDLERLGYSFDPYLSGITEEFENTFDIEISLFLEKDSDKVIGSEINNIDSGIFNHEEAIYNDF